MTSNHVLNRVVIGDKTFDLFDESRLKPWDMIKDWDRDVQWYDKFRSFLELGRKRRMVPAYNSYKKDLLAETGVTLISEQPPQSWFKQRTSAHWELRAKAYDDFIEFSAQRELADQIIERRKKVMLEDYEVGDELRQRARELLVQLRVFDRAGTREITDPVTGQKRTIEVVKPAVSFSQVTTALDTASKLQRRALGIRDDVVLLLQDQQRLLGTGPQESDASWEGAVESLESVRLIEELKIMRERVKLLEGILSQHGIQYPQEERIALPTFIDGGELVIDGN